jgi:GntR family transcriptional regulator/MocR family aminotransferase
MKRGSANAALVPVHVERTAQEPLHRQVYRELVQLILSGRLRPGARVPSSRMLADELSVARNTVLLALEQLMSEGYVETRHGSGTYVSLELPDTSPLRLQGDASKRGRRPVLARRVSFLVASANRPIPAAGLLRPGEPDCAGFPFGLWTRLLAESWRVPSRGLLLGEGAGGFPPLRSAIADYRRRASQLHGEQIIIVSGIRQALTIVAPPARSGDRVWLENQLFRLRAAGAAGAELVPVEVDARAVAAPRRPRRGQTHLHCARINIRWA